MSLEVRFPFGLCCALCFAHPCSCDPMQFPGQGVLPAPKAHFRRVTPATGGLSQTSVSTLRMVRGLSNPDFSCWPLTEGFPGLYWVFASRKVGQELSVGVGRAS